MINFRMDLEHLREWREKYLSAQKSYAAGFISRIEAVDALRNLRFRDDALKAEMKEWELARIRHRNEEHARKIEERNESRRKTPR